MFSSATAVLMKDAAFEVVEPKSTLGAAVAFEPRAFLRKATWAFSSTVTRLEEDLGLLVLDELALLLVGGRLVVEGGLEVLEREGEVEDADVALAEGGGRAALAALGHRGGGGEGADQGAAADDRAARKAGLLEEAEPGVALVEGFSRVVGRLADNVVDVGLFEGCIRFHCALL